MFLSESGKDEWPVKGFDGELHYRPDSHGLKPDTDYYLYAPENFVGSPLMRHGIEMRYTSTGSDDVLEIEDLGAEFMIHPITGQPGTWYPDLVED